MKNKILLLTLILCLLYTKVEAYESTDTISSIENNNSSSKDEKNCIIPTTKEVEWYEVTGLDTLKVQFKSPINYELRMDGEWCEVIVVDTFKLQFNLLKTGIKFSNNYKKEISEQLLEVAEKNDSLESNYNRSNSSNKEKTSNVVRQIIFYCIIIIVTLALLVVFLFKKSKPTLVSESIEDNCDSKEENETDTVASQTTEVTETKQESKQVYNDESSDYRDGCFSIDKDNCLIIGASVRGKGHIQTDLPCQDSNKYTYLTKGWGIAVVSDGAGSATKSQIGSRLVVERATKHFMEVIKEMAWVERNELPSDLEWAQIAYSVLRRVYVDIGNFAQQKNINIKELNATAIVLIHSPFGLLSTHIGDGRAGYRNNSGEWLPVIVPHKGEEANQTIFITSQFWDRPSFRMSDHLIPDSVVIREKITGFTLMSDGCENTSWQVSQMDTNTGKVCDPNRPFRGFFDPLTNTLVKFHNDRIDVNKRSEAWYSFLDTGREFSKEVDDKTLILGIIL